jgi:hypothetical protein
MTPIPLTTEIEAVARRIVWFEEPASAVQARWKLKMGRYPGAADARAFQRNGRLGFCFNFTANVAAGLIRPPRVYC